MSELTRKLLEELCNGDGEVTLAGLRMIKETDAALRAKVEALEKERHLYQPLCLLCGKDQPCMTDAEAAKHGASPPCTFEPTPRQLYDENKRLKASLAACEQEKENYRATLEAIEVQNLEKIAQSFEFARLAGLETKKMFQGIIEDRNKLQRMLDLLNGNKRGKWN